ncbi:MAG: hypothetical protein ACKO5K_17490 [Armatimonadota bacterium]
MKQDRKKLIALAVLLVVGAGIAFLLSRPAPPEPAKGSVYYTGPMINKSRTAIVDEAGNVIKKLDPNRPDKDGTAVGPGRNAPADADVATPGEGARPSGN